MKGNEAPLYDGPPTRRYFLSQHTRRDEGEESAVTGQQPVFLTVNDPQTKIWQNTDL